MQGFASIEISIEVISEYTKSLPRDSKTDGNPPEYRRLFRISMLTAKLRFNIFPKAFAYSCYLSVLRFRPIGYVKEEPEVIRLIAHIENM